MRKRKKSVGRKRRGKQKMVGRKVKVIKLKRKKKSQKD